MAQKMAAYGAIVKYGSTAVGEVRSVTPPSNVRERVESDDLSSTIKTSLPGVYAEDEIEFVQLYEPGDADHEAINTLQAFLNISNNDIILDDRPALVRLTPQFWLYESSELTVSSSAK